MIGRNVEGISMSPVIAKDSEPQNEVIVPIEAWHGMAWHGMLYPEVENEDLTGWCSFE